MAIPRTFPRPARDTNHYFARTARGYEDLYRRLTNQPRAIKPELGKLRSLPPAERKIGSACRAWLSGVGKTQTALEYAHRNFDSYLYTFWTVADSRDSIVSGYVTIAGLLKLPEADSQDQTLAVNALKLWLMSHRGWLLILDNADDLAMAIEFIPPGNNGHVLLTTRARASGAVARRLDIEEMGTEEGALFLLRRAKYIGENAPLDAAAEADQATAKEITAQLDGLPLALDQAGAYIEETACGQLAYLELYRNYAPSGSSGSSNATRHIKKARRGSVSFAGAKLLPIESI